MINTIIGVALSVYGILGQHDYVTTALICFAGGWILATKSKDK